MAWPLNKPHSSGQGNYIKVKAEDFHEMRPGAGGAGRGSGARPAYSTGHSRGIPGGSNSYAGSSRDGPAGSTHVMQALEARQAEQNSGLAYLDSSVTRLGELSLGISREIDLQNRMLDQLDEDTDKAQSQADMLTRRTADLVKQTGGPKTCMVIVILTAVFVLLLLLVIYT